MSTKIIDLDAVLGDDKKVRLAGKTYTLPPDIPVELYLKLNRESEQERTDAEVVSELYEDVLGLFKYGDPKITKLPISLGQLLIAIGRVYGSDSEPGVEDPPTRRTAGSRSSSRASNGKSRSSR